MMDRNPVIKFFPSHLQNSLLSRYFGHSIWAVSHVRQETESYVQYPSRRMSET
jgi:hypothetical protein